MVQEQEEAEFERKSACGGQGLHPEAGGAAGGQGRRRGVQLRGRGPEGLLPPGCHRSVLGGSNLALCGGDGTGLHPLTDPMIFPLDFISFSFPSSHLPFSYPWLDQGRLDGQAVNRRDNGVPINPEWCFHTVMHSLQFPASAQNLPGIPWCLGLWFCFALGV